MSQLQLFEIVRNLYRFNDLKQLRDLIRKIPVINISIYKRRPRRDKIGDEVGDVQN